MTDFELLDAWAAGDQRAATQLIDRHFDAVYRFFRNKLGPDNVEDLVQDTLLACIKARPSFRRDASFRTFLFATARNVLFHHFRRVRRDGDPIDPDTVSMVDLAPGPSLVVARRREQRLLLEALRAIPLDYQIAIELYHWEGMSGPELAEVLGVTEAALRSRLVRAKAELRRQLERLADAPETLASTLAGLDDWAEGLRAIVQRGGDA